MQPALPDRDSLLLLDPRSAEPARIDALSGLYSREVFLRLARARLRCQAGGAEAFLIVCSPDRLRTLHDSLGRTRAAQVLHASAQRLVRLLPGALHGRAGEKDFALLIEARADLDLAALWMHLQSELALPIACDGLELRPVFSAGVARIGSAGPEAALEDATAALHHAQSGGGAGCEFYREALRSEARERMELECELRRALERRELMLHYQPVVDPRDGSLRGLEALARWHHPLLGRISPERFIPVAEESGLIHELGLFVLHETLAQIAAWRARAHALGDTRVSINVSARQLEDERLVEALLREPARLAVPARQLCLEVTESALVRDGAAALARLERVRARGVVLALDDFGTGYASLQQLCSLPLDIVKVDRSLMSGVGEDARSTGVFEALCSLADSLSLCVVAEGIEKRQQLETLQRLGCRAAQGFLWSPALPAAALEGWCERARRQSA